MKIVVFADIHSNLPVFNKAYQDSLTKNIDMYLFLGDYVTDGYEADKIIDIIKSTNGHAINGNRDVAIVEYHKEKNPNWDKYMQYWNLKYGYNCLKQDSIEYLETLPIYKIINIGGKKICMAHNTPYGLRGNVLEDNFEMFDRLVDDFDCDVYLMGHTHISYNIEYKDRQFINVGSIGLPTDGLPFKYGILTISDSIEYEQIKVDYDYNELENYYKNSEYYKEVTIWCSILLELLKSGADHPQFLLDYAFAKCDEKGIDRSEGIPNDLFEEYANEYMTKIKRK